MNIRLLVWISGLDNFHNLREILSQVMIPSINFFYDELSSPSVHDKIQLDL